MQRELKRSIGFFGAVSVMVGVIIGSGIFKTPPGIALHLVNQPWLIIGLWVAGGLLCLAGALTYAEMAAMYPASGGVYVFLREGFGNVTAFVFGWSYLLLVKPFAAGGIAFVFGETLNQLLHVQWDVRITTSVMLLLLTLINYRGVGLATNVAKFLTAIKFGALTAIVLITGFLAIRDWSSLEARSAFIPPEYSPGVAPSMVNVVVAAMSAILWTYDGWADVGSIAGEVKNPQKQLPRIYILGTLSVIAIYVLVNLAYMVLVPLPEMAYLGWSIPGFSVAPLVMERLIGPVGAIAVLVVILLSTLGSSHSSVMTGARVSYAQARDGLLFRFIGHVHPRFATPDAALFSQVALAIVAVWFLGNFNSLMEGFVFTMWIYYGLAGAAIFVLRHKRPLAHRPFRCPGFPFVPLAFVIASFGMAVFMILKDPRTTLPWIGVLVAGVPVYFLWRTLWPVPVQPPDSGFDACVRCKHDLTGSTVSVCPGCGESVAARSQCISASRST